MTKNMLDLKIELWPIDQLVPYARNSRTHSETQVAQVAASIAEFGFVNPILVGADRVLIAGHARLLAARKLEFTEVPVIRLEHLSESQRRALVIADNRLALNAGWDEEMLALELGALKEEDFNLEILGMDDDELNQLLAADAAAEGLTDEDAVPEVPENPVSRTGDLWLLGAHRLLVGDATIPADIQRLMTADLAHFVFSDPPYNIDYQGYTKDRLSIQNDQMSAEQFKTFLRNSFQNFRQAVKPAASLYICHSSSWQREFQNALEEAGFQVRCQIIWAKNTFAWGFGRYKFQHEPIFYCHVAGEKDSWYGDKSQSTLWEENKPTANRLHPTMKPVELVERALVNSSKAGDLVLDLFGGSGTTLIGCERTKRKARLMELDPRYADVIVGRYQEYSGKPAVLDGDGRTFTEIMQARLGATAA
jgi:DNA modification methylase